MHEAIHDYNKFAGKLLLTSFFTIIISSNLQAIVQSLFPASSVWMFSLVQIGIGSVGLWWVAKNGKE